MAKVNYQAVKDGLDGLFSRMDQDDKDLNAAENRALRALADLAEVRRRIPAREVTRSVTRTRIGKETAEQALRRYQ